MSTHSATLVSPSLSSTNGPASCPQTVPDDFAYLALIPAVAALLNLPQTGITTVMVKGIPFSCTQRLLLRAWQSANILNGVTLMYLPVDRKRRTNLGYCFVDFTNALLALQFCSAVGETRLEGLRCRKPLSTAPARVQGFAANFRSFLTTFAQSNRLPDHVPLLFDPDTGTEVVHRLSRQRSVVLHDRRCSVAAMGSRLLRLVHDAVGCEHLARVVVGLAVQESGEQHEYLYDLLQSLHTRKQVVEFVHEKVSGLGQFCWMVDNAAN